MNRFIASVGCSSFSNKGLKRETVELNEKVVCFWSKDYDDREKHKREDLEKKLNTYLNDPSKYNASNRFGLKKYLTLTHVNEETGVIEKIKPHLEFDQKKVCAGSRTGWILCDHQQRSGAVKRCDY